MQPLEDSHCFSENSAFANEHVRCRDASQALSCYESTCGTCLAKLEHVLTSLYSVRAALVTAVVTVSRMPAVHREENETGITPVLLLLDAYVATPDGVAVAAEPGQKQRAVLDPYDNSLVPLPFSGSSKVDPAADAVWLTGAGPLPLCSTRSPGRCAPDNSVTEIRAWATNLVLQVCSYAMSAAIRDDGTSTSMLACHAYYPTRARCLCLHCRATSETV